MLLANVAILDLQRSAPAVARANLAESLRHLAGVEAPVAACTAIHAAAAAAASCGEREPAARWFGAVEALWRAIGSAPERVDSDAFAPILERLRETLGAAAFAAACEGGAGLPLETALRETREWAEAGPATEPSRPAP